MNILLMRAKILVFTIMLLLLSGCALSKTPQIVKIALLAPFERQYREIGYDALYAARLAIADSGLANVDLLPLDDGGRIETAQARVLALSQDPSVVAVLVMGPYSTSDEAQMALDGIPMIIVGNWNAHPVNESVYMLSNPQIDNMIDFEGNINELANLTQAIQGSEMLALEQIPLLIDDLSLLHIISSGSLPDVDFRERYLNSAEFAPEPSLLASLTYDATRIILQSIQNNTPIAEMSYEGINGHFSFENGYWVDAPIHEYEYIDGELVLSN